MLTEAEKRRLAELYSAGYEQFFGESAAAEKARAGLAEFLEQLHQRECPHQPLREFRHGCTRMAKLWLKANDPHYPFLH